MVAGFVYSSILKMEEICYSHTSVNYQQTIRRHIPEESAIQIITRVLFGGCETWSVILRKKHRLRAFENRMMKRIFEYMRS
jgi:hypothetical protein